MTPDELDYHQSFRLSFSVLDPLTNHRNPSISKFFLFPTFNTFFLLPHFP